MAEKPKVIYERAAETAKKIRVELKKAFPGVKFSVRSDTYSGGSSVDVSWIDGPMSHDVERITSRFQSASFDGMQDLKTTHGYMYEGQLYNGADWVTAQRELSDEWRARLKSKAAEMFEPDIWGNFSPWQMDEAEESLMKGPTGRYPSWHTPRDEESAQDKNVKCAVCGNTDIEESGNDGGMGWCNDCHMKQEIEPCDKPAPDVTVTMNEEKDGVEIRFAEKPAAGILEMLKENGFHWSGRGFWYAKRTDARIKLANALAETTKNEESQAPSRAEPATIEEPKTADNVINFFDAKARKLTTWTPVQTLMLHTIGQLLPEDVIAEALANGVTPEKLFEIVAMKSSELMQTK